MKNSELLLMFNYFWNILFWQQAAWLHFEIIRPFIIPMKNFYKTNQVKEQTTFVQNQWDNFKLDVGEDI